MQMNAIYSYYLDKNKHEYEFPYAYNEFPVRAYGG